MNLKRLFTVSEFSNAGNVSLLLLRLVAGVAFLYHGWGKIQNPMGWMGPDAPVPGFLQGLAAIAEFGGGLAWVLGLLMPLASFGLLCTMAVAASFHISKGDPFVAMGPGLGSWELAGVYLVVSILFLSFGPGAYSVDRQVFGRR